GPVEVRGIDGQPRRAAARGLDSAQLDADAVLAGGGGVEVLHRSRMAADGNAGPEAQPDLFCEPLLLHLLPVPAATVVRSPLRDLLFRGFLGDRLRENRL